MGGNVERHIGDDDRDGAAIEALQPGGNGMTHAARDVLAERQRQIEVEDDPMTRDETLIRAALEMAATEAEECGTCAVCGDCFVSATAIRAIDPAEVLAKVGAAETTAGSWALDTSTDSEILVKGGCSVIEGNDAHYLLRLIAADTSTPTPDANARWWSGEATIGEIREVAAQHAVARLVEAARAGLNYLENTEGEFGITLGSATGLRAALAAMEASDDRT